MHDQPRPSTDWLEEPELPSAEDILSNSATELLLINNDEITSKAEYLEKHYRMQRYEAVEPTRLAVCQFCKSPDMSEGDLAYIYTEVSVPNVLSGIKVLTL